MVTQANPTGFESGAAAPDEIVAAMRAAVLAGTPWFDALLTAIAHWRQPEEVVAGRPYRYLVGGEAFDWLLLAERILDELAEIIPAAEKDALIYHGQPPADVSAEHFRRAIGPAKHRAYLNFLYGVTVEEALQLAYEEEIEKERRAHISWGRDALGRAVFERIYGAPEADLLAVCRAESGLEHTETMGLDEQKAFTYWLFKYRLRSCDPARVASDTTRGLERLARLEALRRPTASTLMPAQDILDLRASRCPER